MYVRFRKKKTGGFVVAGSRIERLGCKGLWGKSYWIRKASHVPITGNKI